MADCEFTASLNPIDADTSTMDVTAIGYGALAVGQVVIGLAPAFRILELGTGTGGTGTYIVSRSQTHGQHRL